MYRMMVVCSNPFEPVDGHGVPPNQFRAELRGKKWEAFATSEGLYPGVPFPAPVRGFTGRFHESFVACFLL
jgi:hypothetical protein